VKPAVAVVAPIERPVPTVSEHAVVAARVCRAELELVATVDVVPK
jgi:hypothetical protein